MSLFSSKARPCGGFTLVELLVTIVIVVVLASVALAVGLRFKEKANAAACASNLRQVGLLLNAAAAEKSGLYPQGGPPKGYISRLFERTETSFPNTGSEEDAPFFEKGPGKIFMCPSDKEGKRSLHKSYLANPWIVGIRDGDGGWLGGGAFAPSRVQSIRQPSRTFLVIEDWTRNSKLWRGNGLRFRGDLSKDADNPAHGEGRHFLYVDGHVEFLTQDPGLTDEGYAVHYRGE